MQRKPLPLEQFGQWRPQLLPGNLRNKKILIVDDSRVQRAFLSEVFSRVGIRSVITAENGADAIEILFRERPHLVVTDIIMPRMNGFELCKLIRKHEQFTDVPILVQTGLDSEEERLRIFEYGASDLVTKPVHPDEIIARARAHLEKQELMLSFRQLQQTLKEEFHTANNMQSMLEPDPLLVQEIARDYRLQITGKIIQTKGLGGDTWGLRRLPNHRCAFFMVDFPGRGITTTMNLFRLQLLLNQLAPLTDDPGTLLAMLNRRLYLELPRSSYAKMLWAVYDQQRDELSYAIAGGLRALVYSDSRPIVNLDIPHLPLGVSEEAIFQTKRLPFHRDDTLMAYSDMIDAMKDPDGAHILIHTMLDMVMGNHYLGLGTRHTRMVEFLTHMTSPEANYDIPDDLTVMLITRCE
ncbi:MAG: fused response regulator/phosphatase [Rickettsiales bacterium]